MKQIGKLVLVFVSALLMLSACGGNPPPPAQPVANRPPQNGVVPQPGQPGYNPNQPVRPGQPGQGGQIQCQDDGTGNGAYCYDPSSGSYFYYSYNSGSCGQCQISQ